MKIIVNGVEKEVDATSTNYWDIVMLAFGRPMMALQTITYYHREGDLTRSGSVVPHEAPLDLMEGMVFNCCFTGNA